MEGGEGLVVGGGAPQGRRQDAQRHLGDHIFGRLEEQQRGLRDRSPDSKCESVSDEDGGGVGGLCKQLKGLRLLC